MKKLMYILILLMIIILPKNVQAEGDISVSESTMTIEQGSTKTFKITAYNTIGDVIIKSNNTEIANVDINQWETGMVGSNETKEVEIKVTGKNIGTTKIILELDAATFDSEDLSGQTRIITVDVIEKQNVSDSEIEDNENKPEEEPTEGEDDNTKEDEKPENVGGDEEQEEITTPSDELEIINPPTGSKLLIVVLIAICAIIIYIVNKKKYKKL